MNKKFILLIVLDALAGANSYLRFWGEWLNFIGIFGMQILMLCTIHSYLKASKSQSVGSNSAVYYAACIPARKLCCTTCYVIPFLLIFFFKNKKASPRSCNYQDMLRGFFFSCCFLAAKKEQNYGGAFSRVITRQSVITLTLTLDCGVKPA